MDEVQQLENRPTAAAWRDQLIANCFPDLLSLDGIDILRHGCEFVWPDGRDDVMVVRIDPALGDNGLEKIRAFLAKARARWPIALDTIEFEWWEKEPLMLTDAHGTDFGNAQRLVARHGTDLRYCWHWREWLIWDGRRWGRDGTGEVLRRAQETAISIYAEATEGHTKKERKEIGNWAYRSESTVRLKAMLEQAKALLPVEPEELDADPWLLAVNNGVLDLQTGKLLAHDPDLYITKLAPVDYDPDAQLDLWDRFLKETTGGDEKLQRFLQMAVGYGLTGCTNEEKLFFVHGPTAAGKTTFIEAIKATLGDYATTADFETFLTRRVTGGPRTDIARLAGARFVASVEVDEGKRLAEGLVKTLTGGDTVTTRFLYSSEFEFVPAFKLWLAANHAPKLRDDDSATWRRVLRVPFEHTVPEEKIDPAVKATLKDPKIAGPAILAWAVRGCLAWQEQGLVIPDVVRVATADLRDEMNPLKEFFDECCEFGPEHWTPVSKLRTAYENHAAENGERYLICGKQWGDRLRAKDCKQERRTVDNRQVRGWAGIGLLDAEATKDKPKDTEDTKDTTLLKSETNSPHKDDFSKNPSNTSFVSNDPIVQAALDLGGAVSAAIVLEDGTTVPF